MLIPTTAPSIAASLESLVADNIRNHPVLVDEVGVKVRAIRAIIAVFALLIPRTNGRGEVAIGYDRVIRIFLGDRH